MKRARALKVTVDGYTRVCLTAIAVLMTVLVLALWVQGVPAPAGASAAGADDATFGDSAGQRKAMIKNQEDTNAKLDELIKLFKEGGAKVQVQGGANAASTKPK